ncbi:MAG: hypothetical protein ACI83O_000850 [Patescibacteria group bacterium]|jgi:hypothetical protein
MQKEIYSTVITLLVLIVSILAMQFVPAPSTSTTAVIIGTGAISTSTSDVYFTIDLNQTNQTTPQDMPDTTAPTYDSLSPSNGYEKSSRQMTFRFTVSDDSQINQCILTVDGRIKHIFTNIISDIPTSNTFTFSKGTHTWYLTCTDGEGNSMDSQTRTFKVISDSSSSSSNNDNNDDEQIVIYQSRPTNTNQAQTNNQNTNLDIIYLGSNRETTKDNTNQNNSNFYLTSKLIIFLWIIVILLGITILICLLVLFKTEDKEQEYEEMY